MAALRRQRSALNSVDGEKVELKHESPSTPDLRDDLTAATRVAAIKDEATSSTSSSPLLSATKIKSSRSSSQSTTNSTSMADTVAVKSEPEKVNGHVSVKAEPPTPVKESRLTSRKGAVPRVAPLFDHLPDATADATSHYQTLESCTYANKYLGYTEHAMECDCSEEWDSVAKKNNACGEDSDCINRATKMECVGDCACGIACQNQRFQQRQFADVSVIKTEKKGYGLRANTDLRAGDFIFEYIGEVINEGQFRRRMLQYDDEGIKHFYFMSLSRGEFVDATRRGNLGRFCNHSCNPNCFVDKWVVGDKLRMGIFAERRIRAGEELVFNYNVDRYGAKPQPCYCGEANCTGFIGGKTQTERATKLSAATIEALGIEDVDTWDTTVAKRPRKKKTGEDDEDYVDSVEAKVLDADSVTKVMAALMQCKEKWIAAKLLQRIQTCDDEQVRNRVVRLHGYQILNSQLSAWKDDENIILQILDILDKFPRLTRNKIIDSKIESTLKPMIEHEDERVTAQATRLLDEWSKLEVAYRIPRKRRDLTETNTPTKTETIGFERRESGHERKRSKSRSRSKSPPRGPAAISAPSGPRSSLPQRNLNFSGPRPPFNRTFPALPRGWSSAIDNTGRTYYYSVNGETTWAKPTRLADQPPPPPKQPSQQDVLKSIIDNIVEAKEKEQAAKKNTTPDTPKELTKREKKEKKEEKWKSFDEDKKRKLYENTLFPHISHVMNKYKSKIPKDDLKRFAKEIAKKLVASDFKSGRINDPTKIDEKHQHKVKKFCKDYFDKAAHKHKKHEQERAARKAAKGGKSHREAPPSSSATPSQLESPSLTEKAEAECSPEMADVKKEDESEDEDIKMSDDDMDMEDYDAAISPTAVRKDVNGQDSSSTLKRKRSFPTPVDMASIPKPEPDDDNADDFSQSPLKKANLDSDAPPPPPPPPPSASPSDMNHAETSFKKESMADVLAQAQADDDGGDGEVDMDTPMDIEEDENEEGRDAEEVLGEDTSHDRSLTEANGVYEAVVVRG